MRRHTLGTTRSPWTHPKPTSGYVPAWVVSLIRLLIIQCRAWLPVGSYWKQLFRIHFLILDPVLRVQETHYPMEGSHKPASVPLAVGHPCIKLSSAENINHNHTMNKFLFFLHETHRAIFELKMKSTIFGSNAVLILTLSKVFTMCHIQEHFYFMIIDTWFYHSFPMIFCCQGYSN